MDVAICIQTTNDCCYLDKTLGSIRRQTASDVEATVLENAQGGAAQFNSSMRNTDAPIVILLEAGCIVAPRWLDHLVVAALEASPRAGLAGPSTNRAWNEQRVFEGASENDVEATAAEAERRFGSECRTLAPLYSLADFCYAVKREVFEAVGPADEGYGLGPCWETDYHIRAAIAAHDEELRGPA